MFLNPLKFSLIWFFLRIKFFEATFIVAKFLDQKKPPILITESSSTHLLILFAVRIYTYFVGIVSKNMIKLG